MDKRPYSYEFSPLAEQDLNEVFDYIATELLSPEVAENLINNIQDSVEKLCGFPFSRPLLKNKRLREKGYRLLIVQNLNLFYIIEEQKIVIRRVLHSKRNFESIL